MHITLVFGESRQCFTDRRKSVWKFWLALVLVAVCFKCLTFPGVQSVSSLNKLWTFKEWCGPKFADIQRPFLSSARFPRCVSWVITPQGQDFHRTSLTIAAWHVWQQVTVLTGKEQDGYPHRSDGRVINSVSWIWSPAKLLPQAKGYVCICVLCVLMPEHVVWSHLLAALTTRPVPAGETFVSMRIGDYQKQSRQLIAIAMDCMLSLHVIFHGQGGARFPVDLWFWWFLDWWVVLFAWPCLHFSDT